jgi:methionyl-tRNA formyltransferase
MDAGPIVLQERLRIAPEDDYLSLEPRLAQLGARLLVDALSRQPAEQPQDDARATYCKKIERDDARIDWTRAADEIWRQVRAYRGWPQAFTTWDGKLLKVLRTWPLPDANDEPARVVSRDGAPVVQTGIGALRLDEVVLEGRRPQTGADFLRGYQGLIGSRLG